MTDSILYIIHQRRTFQTLHTNETCTSDFFVKILCLFSISFVLKKVSILKKLKKPSKVNSSLITKTNIYIQIQNTTNTTLSGVIYFDLLLLTRWALPSTFLKSVSKYNPKHAKDYTGNNDSKNPTQQFYLSIMKNGDFNSKIC